MWRHRLSWFRQPILQRHNFDRYSNDDNNNNTLTHMTRRNREMSIDKCMGEWANAMYTDRQYMHELCAQYSCDCVVWLCVSVWVLAMTFSRSFSSPLSLSHSFSVSRADIYGDLYDLCWMKTIARAGHDSLSLFFLVFQQSPIFHFDSIEIDNEQFDCSKCVTWFSHRHTSLMRFQVVYVCTFQCLSLYLYLSRHLSVCMCLCVFVAYAQA